MIRLHYWFSRSGRAEQLRLLLAELDLRWREVDTEWGSDAWRELTPEPLWFGAQPAIVEPDGTSLTQSGVILSYLARKHGLDRGDLRDQARVDALVWTAEDLRMAVFRATSGDSATAKTAKFVEGEWPNRWLVGLDTCLSRNEWVAGPAFTQADLALWDAVDQARAKIPALPWPEGAVARWAERVAARPRIAAYLRSDRRPPS